MITDKQLDLLKILVMLILIVTMVVLSIVLYKYGYAVKIDPCSLCENCTKFEMGYNLG